jgi:putative transposase
VPELFTSAIINRNSSIINQPEHHRMQTFQEEYREFLQRHHVEFDEQYMWD